MKRLSLSLILLALSSCAHPAKAAAPDCNGCGDLKTIEQEYINKKNATGQERADLQLRASAIIKKMPAAKDLKLTANQVKAFVALLRVGLPKDPGEALVMNNAAVINANRAAIEKEISTLPKKESEFLMAALVGADAEDSDYSQDTPAKK